jgi:hypothetical protein
VRLRYFKLVTLWDLVWGVQAALLEKALTGLDLDAEQVWRGGACLHVG